MQDLWQRIREACRSGTEEVRDWRRALHRHPELGFEEHATADFIVGRLQEMGLQPQRVAGTGVLADFGGGDQERRVALRADMDGLPILEETGLPFASEHHGVMHACGHDGHVAMLLGAAKALLTVQGELPAPVRLLFQPSEERLPGGAPALIEAGALRGVSRIFGLHLWTPLAVGEVAMIEGAMMANTDEFEITIEGRGGHGAKPHLTKDAALIAADLVMNLQTVVSRSIDPLDPVVVTVGALQAGTTFNVIPQRAKLLGTVRSLSDQARTALRHEIARVVEGTAALHGVQAAFNYIEGYPALLNDAQSVQLLRAAVEQAGLDLNAVAVRPSLGGEDFAYYLRQVPGGFAFLGARPTVDRPFDHHSPYFDFDERALPLGVAMLALGALTLMKA